MTFAEKLKEVMKEQNLSQSDLSRLTGIGRSSISQYLSGRNIPTLQRQEDIAIALNLSADYFIAENVATDEIIAKARIKRLTLTQAARIMGVSKEKLGDLIEEGAYSWGRKIPSKGKKRNFLINGNALSKIECIDLGL